jgi:hypothetical protein
VLGWALRERRDVSWAAPQGPLDEPALIVAGSPPPNAEEPAFGPGAYAGREYLVAGSYDPQYFQPGSFDWRLALRWWLTREPRRDLTLGTSTVLDRASLFLRVDEVNP